MRTLPLQIISSLALISLLASCGKKESSSSSSQAPRASVPQEEEVQISADGSNIQGIYLAKFQTLNPHVNGTLPGSATIQRKDDRLYAYIRLFAGGPKVWHPQNIYSGNRCPTMEDDTNKDGYLDIIEASAVLGKIIVPLDADIGSQRSGRNFYPLGDLSGSYFYERITSFKRFFRDLKEEDKDTEDNIRKLGPEEGLPIIGQPVLIQGVLDTTEFPETVGSTERYRPFQTLPIACGIFQKVEAEPGEVDDGEIPGPIAEVEEGQDRPAPEGEGEIEGDGSTIPTGGSNDAESGDTPTSDGSGSTPDEDTSTTGDSGTSGGSSTTSGGSTSGDSSTTGGSSEDEDRTTNGRSTTGGSSTTGRTGTGGPSTGGSSDTTGGTSSGGSSNTTGGSTTGSGSSTTGTTGGSTTGEDSSDSDSDSDEAEPDPQESEDPADYGDDD